MLFNETIRLLAEEPFYTNVAVAFGISIILSSILAVIIVREDTIMSNKTTIDRIVGLNLHGAFMSVSNIITSCTTAIFDGVGLLVQACWSTTTLITLEMAMFIFTVFGFCLHKGFEFIGTCVDETVPFLRGFAAPFKAVWEHIPSFKKTETETETETDHSWIEELDEELNQPSEIEQLKAEMAEMKKQIERLTDTTAVQTKRIGRLEWKLSNKVSEIALLKADIDNLKAPKVEPVLEEEDEGIVEMIVDHAKSTVRAAIEDFDMNSKLGRAAARTYLWEQGVKISKTSSRTQIVKAFSSIN